MFHQKEYDCEVAYLTVGGKGDKNPKTFAEGFLDVEKHFANQNGNKM